MAPMISEQQLAKMPDSTTQCLRCDKPMKDVGLLNLHEGPRLGVLGAVGELSVRRVEFEVFACPNCGKVEFFL